MHPLKRQLGLLVCFFLVAAAPKRALCADSRAELVALVPSALSADATRATAARSRLRAAGPLGLAALFVTQREAIIAMRTKPLASRTAAELRLKDALESVARQRDVEYSELYWYTDLNEARAEATRLGRPILSLRLLGELTDELSCANSRFFRSSLYSNPSIADLLRSRFVLHWSTERPVPKVRIDYGDGRVIDTTITGNSIHYLLDSQGRVFDGLPGLYTPGLFRRLLEEALPELLHAGGESEADFLRRRTAFHQRGTARRTAELARAKFLAFALPSIPLTSAIAVSKSRVEAPIAGRLAAQKAIPVLDSEAEWQALAKALGISSSYEPAAFELIDRKLSSRSGAGRQAAVASYTADALTDAARNEYSTHMAIANFLRNAADSRPETLNQFVYAKLFAMPREDKWLGLFAEDVFNGIEGGGIE